MEKAKMQPGLDIHDRVALSVMGGLGPGNIAHDHHPYYWETLLEILS